MTLSSVQRPVGQMLNWHLWCGRVKEHRALAKASLCLPGLALEGAGDRSMGTTELGEKDREREGPGIKTGAAALNHV